MLGRFQNSVVLGCADYQVVLFPPVLIGRPQHGDIVRLGAAGGEVQLGWLAIYERGNLLATLLQRHFGLTSETVHRAGVTELPAEKRQHRLDHLGVDRGGGVVV